MQRNVNLAGGGKHIFWWELNLADKHKIEYDKRFFYQKMIYIFYQIRQIRQIFFPYGIKRNIVEH